MENVKNANATVDELKEESERELAAKQSNMDALAELLGKLDPKDREAVQKKAAEMNKEPGIKGHIKRNWWKYLIGAAAVAGVGTGIGVAVHNSKSSDEEATYLPEQAYPALPEQTDWTGYQPAPADVVPEVVNAEAEAPTEA